MSTKPPAKKLLLTLFGMTRSSVLTLLFAQPGRSFHFRQLVRAVGTGLGAVQRELRLLEKAGLIRRFRDRRRVCYEADTDCPIYADLARLLRKSASNP